MKTRSNARDWETRSRLYAAGVLGWYQLLSMSLYAAGLVSAEAMLAVRDLSAPFYGTFVFPLLGLALYTHMALGLYKLYRRNTLKMPLWEKSQVALGLTIPLLMLAPHTALDLLNARFGVAIAYDSLLVTYPEVAWRSIAATLVIGLHAHIGTHALLRMRPWYPRARWAIFALFTLLPLAAAAGYLQSGPVAALNPPQTLTEEQLTFYRLADGVCTTAVLVLYALLFLGRELRLVRRDRRLTAAVTYADGSRVAVAPATTLLEASRIGGVPHPSICGGRARCTTCRVRVDSGMENLSPVGEREHKALVRIGATPDLRLACQAECRGGEVAVTILLPPHIEPQRARQETKDSVGRDVELAVMFVDLRGFTSLSDQKFPYDVVYILNNYFQAMGDAITSHGGRVDKFLGDGILAYFGLDQDPREACRTAVEASRAMAASLVALNQRLIHVWPQGLSMGIGLHFGDLVLGEIGSHEKRQLTIIGDTVNTASRLEAMNKEAGSQLILSTKVAALAGIDLSAVPVAAVTPRGKVEPIRVYVVKNILEEVPVP